MNSGHTKECVICGSKDWKKLPDPVNHQIMTTAGKLIQEPLSKVQCSNCGVVQRIEYKLLAQTDYYENHYTYNERPGNEFFHNTRYQSIAKWISESIRPFTPSKILDIGCGDGFIMEAMQRIYPKASIEGIEPYNEAVKIARLKGFEVYQGKVEQEILTNKKFDLVYSTNVIQHTESPGLFIQNLNQYTEPEGLIVLSCPNSTNPSIELVMGDQNFSFAPTHIKTLANNSSLSLLNYDQVPTLPGIFNEQLFVLTIKLNSKNQQYNVPELNSNSIYKERVKYLKAWNDLDNFLSEQYENAYRVFNFGAGMWTQLIAAYCPNYWNKVYACIIDQFEGRCLNKPVLPFQNIKFNPNDQIFLGVNPRHCQKLHERFKKLGLETLSSVGYIDN